MALSCVLATVGPTMANGPQAGFKLNPAATFKSPDQTMLIEQYFKDGKDGSVRYQIWTFDGDHRHAQLLNPGEDDEIAGYRAGFRFSPDSQWLVRIQKLSAGYATLYLYHRKAYQFSPATKNTLAIWRGIFSLRHRIRRECTAIQRTSIRSIMQRWHWSREWKKLRRDGTALARQPLYRGQPEL
jgi:hypothetical protein